MLGMQRKEHELEAHKCGVWGADNWDTLKRMYKDYKAFESGNKKMVFEEFVIYMYHEAQDVVHMASNEELWVGTNKEENLKNN